ncbi:hypothetical protein TNCT_679701 [Trichonephila clavata]|uniref:Uncharacterized protein n=1 Tax=Trichonephila clavata TaxID=2740835 RepID=A0A8X6LB04_TRICU|nr:hypothetical protein TNCT_679701 [Trichonephila clavata]
MCGILFRHRRIPTDHVCDDYDPLDHFCDDYDGLDHVSALPTVGGATQNHNKEQFHIYANDSSIPGSNETGTAYHFEPFEDGLLDRTPTPIFTQSWRRETGAVQSAASELSKSPQLEISSPGRFTSGIQNRQKTQIVEELKYRKRHELEFLIKQGWNLKLYFIFSYFNITRNKKKLTTELKPLLRLNVHALYAP